MKTIIPKSSLKEPVEQEYITKLTLIGTFLAIFTAFTSLVPIFKKVNKKTQTDFVLKPFDLLLLGLATYRLGRMVAYDKVADPIQQPFAKTVPDETGAGETTRPKGSGVKQAIGELVTCPICSGTWIAAGLVYGLSLLPNPTRVFVAIMSTTGLVEILNALTEALSWLGQAERKASGDK